MSLPWLASLLTVLGATSPSQDGPDALSAAQSAALHELLSELRHDDAPGGVLAVLQRGEPCFAEPFGMADLERSAPVTRATVFYLASAAKPFTAAAVLHAAEAGRLALTDSVRARLPALPECFAPVTLSALIEHESGVPDVYDLAIGLDLGSASLATNASAVELLARLAQVDFVPGSRVRYSNSAYVLLAEALRAATGRALPAYAREHLFAPLGMQSARFSGEPELDALPRARSYRRAGERWELLEMRTGLIGPGGLWAGLDDLARWERAAFEGGFGSAALRARISTPADPTALHPQFGNCSAGLMFAADRNLSVVRAAGEAFGFQAEILRYPEQELSVIVLANADLGLDGLAEDAAEVVLREEFRAARAASASARPSAADLARFGRFWRDESSGVPWVLSLDPGRMRVTSLGDWSLELDYAGPERLVTRGTRAPAELVFEPASGPATRMRVRCGPTEVACCRPHPIPPPAPVDPQEFAGEYTLGELGVTLGFRAVKGGLELIQAHPLGPEYVLPPFQALGDDLFVCPAGACLQFRRDESGEIAGARLDVNRASDLELHRR